jgi:hypothetical protein
MNTSSLKEQQQRKIKTQPGFFATLDLLFHGLRCFLYTFLNPIAHPPLHEEQSFGLYGDRPHSCRNWALRLNRASLRREPETAGRYSFNHPKVARIPLCVVWRKSSDNPAVTAFLDILRASRPKIRKQMEDLIRQSNEAA